MNAATRKGILPREANTLFEFDGIKLQRAAITSGPEKRKADRNPVAVETKAHVLLHKAAFALDSVGRMLFLKQPKGKGLVLSRESFAN